MWKQRVTLGTLFVGTILSLPAQGFPQTPAPPGGRIVAVGDIHGSHDGLRSILRASGLVDEAGEWAGGDATLVQTGDMLDRGPQVRRVLDSLMALQGAAESEGARVVVLLGNHEVMNLMSDVRDVTREIYATFATPESEARREQAWRQWTKLQRRHAAWKGETFTTPEEEAKQRWLATRPPGFFEYMEAMGPEGEYGRWLRSLPLAVQIGDTILLHAGIAPELASRSLDEINGMVADEIAAFDRLKLQMVNLGIALPFFTFTDLQEAVRTVLQALESRPQRVDTAARRMLMRGALREFLDMTDWASLSPDGPVWFRGYARWSEDEGNEKIRGILSAHGVERIVVGHSPPRTPGQIQNRFANRVFLIDTGMRAGHYPGGRGSALEIAGDRITAIYEDGRDELVAAEAPAAAPHPTSSPAGVEPDEGDVETDATSWLGPEGTPLPFRNDDEVVEFLRTAEVVSTGNIPVGITDPKKLRLADGGVEAHAVFRHVHEVKRGERLGDGTHHMFFRDSFRGEPAAYELAKLLGLDTVPPVVERRLKRLGRGSVQLWIENAMTEADRRERDIEPPGRIHFIRQLYNMRIFDNLVHNIDRNQGNILIDSAWKVWYIDCTRCFAQSRKLPRPEQVRRIGRDLWQRLQTLDPETVRARLEPHLSPFEIKALMVRHAKLVELLGERIEERGEASVFFTLGDSLTADPEIPEFPPAAD